MASPCGVRRAASSPGLGARPRRLRAVGTARRRRTRHRRRVGVRSRRAGGRVAGSATPARAAGLGSGRQARPRAAGRSGSSGSAGGRRRRGRSGAGASAEVGAGSSDGSGRSTAGSSTAGVAGRCRAASSCSGAGAGPSASSAARRPRASTSSPGAVGQTPFGPSRRPVERLLVAVVGGDAGRDHLVVDGLRPGRRDPSSRGPTAARGRSARRPYTPPAASAATSRSADVEPSTLEDGADHLRRVRRRSAGGPVADHLGQQRDRVVDPLGAQQRAEQRPVVAAVGERAGGTQTRRAGPWRRRAGRPRTSALDEVAGDGDGPRAHHGRRPRRTPRSRRRARRP